MRQDLEQEISVTLARFDKAVKESCTRRHSADPNEPPPPPREPETGLLDLSDRITAEIEGEDPPDGVYIRVFSSTMFVVLLFLFSCSIYVVMPAFTLITFTLRTRKMAVGGRRLFCVHMIGIVCTFAAAFASTQ